MVEMWSQQVLGGPFVDENVDRLLVFDLFYYSNTTRVYLNEHNVKCIGAINPNRFKLHCDMLPIRYAKLVTVLGFLIRQRVPGVRGVSRTRSLSGVFCLTHLMPTVTLIR